jgi:hypothetical protein
MPNRGRAASIDFASALNQAGCLFCEQSSRFCGLLHRPEVNGWAMANGQSKKRELNVVFSFSLQ